MCEDVVGDELHFLFECNNYCYHELNEYKGMSYYFSCINNSFKDLTNIEKWNLISNMKHSQADNFLSRFVIRLMGLLASNCIKNYYYFMRLLFFTYIMVM